MDIIDEFINEYKDNKKTNIDLKNIYNFLKEYEILCKKYNFGIDGCGCCGSPFILTPGQDTILIENVVYYKDEGVYVEGKTIDDFFNNMED